MAKNSKSTTNRIHVAASMRGKQNSLQPKFAEELETEYANDPEMQSWIDANRDLLNSPNMDGSVPFGEDHLDEHERIRARAAEPHDYRRDGS